MRSYENIVKIEEIRKKTDDGDYLSAQKVLDTMDIKKVKNIADLNLMAEVFSVNERYDEAAELYLKIYDKNKTRKSVYQLIDISIKRNNSSDAEYYLSKYEKIAPKDFYISVFRYKIDKLKGEPYEKLIDTLVTLKKTEYSEQWAYELAKLYYKAGMEKECIQECSDIILWFGDGIYVEKAKMLRSYYSGEADKDKIMEELKRRSVGTGLGDDVLVKEEDNANGYNQEDMEETNDDLEDDIYTATDFLTEKSEEDFEVDLRKDVQSILTEEDSILASDMKIAYLPEEADQDTFYQEDMSPSRVEEFDSSKEYDSLEEAEPQEEFSEGSYQEEVIRSDKEQAEKEVEATIYRLLEEDSMDEEDKKLSQIASELQINPDEIFGNFLHIMSIKKQIVKGLESIMQDNTKAMLMMITGTAGAGKTTMAKDMALFLSKAGKLKSSKVAKISAEKLNTVDLDSKRDTLRDCCLVIENASNLKRQTIDKLLELVQSLNGDIAVIFEENKMNMNKLFREYPKLMDLLKNRIHLPQYSVDDLMSFACACLKQQDYRLSPKAEVILKSKISHIVKKSEQHRYLEQIDNLMQEVMNFADIRTGGQLSKLASQGRLKDVEVLSILPEDFKN